jgi:hypothetical protein
VGGGGSSVRRSLVSASEGNLTGSELLGRIGPDSDKVESEITDHSPTF